MVGCSSYIQYMTNSHPRTMASAPRATLSVVPGLGIDREKEHVHPVELVDARFDL